MFRACCGVTVGEGGRGRVGGGLVGGCGERGRGGREGERGEGGGEGGEEEERGGEGKGREVQFFVREADFKSKF